MAEETGRMLTPTPGYNQIKGRAAEIARTMGTPVGAEHLFLGLLHDGGWPVDVIAPLVDPGQAEAAVLAILRGPDYSPPRRRRSRSGRATCPPGARSSRCGWAIPISASSMRCWP